MKCDSSKDVCTAQPVFGCATCRMKAFGQIRTLHGDERDYSGLPLSRLHNVITELTAHRKSLLIGEIINHRNRHKDYGPLGRCTDPERFEIFSVDQLQQIHDTLEALVLPVREPEMAGVAS